MLIAEKSIVKKKQEIRPLIPLEYIEYLKTIRSDYKIALNTIADNALTDYFQLLSSDKYRTGPNIPENRDSLFRASVSPENFTNLKLIKMRGVPAQESIVNALSFYICKMMPHTNKI